MSYDLRSLERTERMMVRWMCGVSLKDRKRSEDLCNLLGINCVADVVRRGRLRWFRHLERKSVDDWMSACRGLVVEGTRGRGRSRKTWEQCVRDDMKLLGLHPEWAVFRDMWRDLIWGKRLTLAHHASVAQPPLVASATKDNFQDRHSDVPMFEWTGAFLSGSRLHRSFCDTRSETAAICHLRAAVHSKNKNSDIWTEVIQGLRSNNLERSSR